MKNHSLLFLSWDTLEFGDNLGLSRMWSAQLEKKIRKPKMTECELYQIMIGSLDLRFESVI